jgi:hypothetical protein
VDEVIGAFFTRLLGGALPWVLAALLGITVYAGMQARQYALEASEHQARAERAEDRAEILLEHQRWQRKQLQTLALVLAKRDEQLQRDDELIDLVRQAARNLERDDAETADWAGQPSPAVVRDWLRDLAEDDDSAGAGGAGDSDDPAAADTRTEAGGDSQP